MYGYGEFSLATRNTKLRCADRLRLAWLTDQYALIFVRLCDAKLQILKNW